MGLRKKIFHPQPDAKLTEEEEKKLDLAWEIFCKKGHVNITDPLNTIEHENIKDILKRDPHAFTRSFCDYHDATGTMPLDKFIEKVMTGE